MQDHESGRARLVSVVMPAYKARYLARTLESVAMQTHRPLELVVCDDSGDDAVESVVQAFAAGADFPVHYSRNPTRLWETASTARGIAIAQGHYVKLLHDDDVMEPECIAALVAAIESSPGIVLASSRRRRINPVGRWLPDTAATLFPFTRDVLVDGPELVSFLADHTINFVGEPSCVLCRREDLLPFGDRLPWLGQARIHWVSDLALYAKLLQHGRLALLSAPLVNVRESPHQFSQAGRARLGIGEQGHADFRAAIRQLGWYRHTAGDAGQVAVAPLDGSAPAQRIDLRQLLADVAAMAQERWRLHEWQARRVPVPAISDTLAAWLPPPPARPRLGILVMAAGRRLTSVEGTVARLPLPAGLMDCIAFRVCDPPAGAVPEGVDHVFAGQGPAALDASVHGWDVEWLLVVQAGTQFSLAGLTRLLVELAGASDGLRAVFADEWHRDDSGAIGPILRPGLDPDLLLGNPSAMTRHWVIRRTAVLEAGGFAGLLDGVAGLDLALRVLERHGPGAIAHLPEPLLACAPPQPDEAAQRAAILRHLDATGQGGARIESLGRGLHRVRPACAAHPPVSVVIIAGGQSALLQRCVLSVLEKTDYPDYELLLVDNGAPPETRQWMEQAAALAGGRVRMFALDGPLPHPAACNLAASQAHGRLLLFLGESAAVLQPQWLELLVEHVQRPGVGAVGARTVSADGKVTHAGLVPGLLAAGGRAFHGEPIDAPGYLGRLRVVHGCAAVADDCMLVDGGVFAGLGGFDAAHFAEGGADIDLCLRIRQAGSRVLCVPDAVLLHAPALPGEAATRRIDDAVCDRWLQAVAADPIHHPALRLDEPGGYRLAEPDLSWRQLPDGLLPRLLVQPADHWGSGQYRVIQPFEALRAAGKAGGACTPRLLGPVELARADPDVVVLQRRIGDVALASVERMQRFSRAFRIYELDDWLPGLPARSLHRGDMPADVATWLRRMLARMDRLVVSTPALAEAMAGYHHAIRVAGNRLDPRMWKRLPAPPERTSGRPRVGWAGGIGHTGDLEMIAGVVRALAGEVDWVFLGMCPDPLRPHVAEFHPGVAFHDYPAALAGLGLDLALAPLEDNRFNRCKSNLRLLEYGACGYAVVCSDVEPYRGDWAATRVRNRSADWLAAIRDHLAERDASAASGRALRDQVHRDWMLEGAALETWLQAWLPD